MSWAARRRFLIVSILVAIGATILAVTLIATLYRAPTCADGVQNQGEFGIDCGGPCPLLCSDQASDPVVRFTQTINVGGRIDVISYVDNPNQDAMAYGAPYTISLYGRDHALAAPRITGTLDLPPGASMPVYVPAAASNIDVAQAFLVIDTAAIRWQRTAKDPRTMPVISNVSQAGSSDTPRVTATLTNPGTAPITALKVIAVIFDSAGNVLAASQTVIPELAGMGFSGQGVANATFTWNGAFGSAPARIDVLPVVPLPSVGA